MEMGDAIVPDLDELEQRDDVAPTAIAVRLDESVKTHELPSRAGVMRSVTLTTTPEPIVGRDLARKRFHMHVYAPAEGVFIGVDRQSVRDGTAYFVGQYGSVDVTHCEPMWARSAAASASATVSILTENWAD